MMLSRLACQSACLALAALFPSSLTPLANAQQTVTPIRHASRVWPLTRPELTNYAETSRYDDVVSFMRAMSVASPKIHLSRVNVALDEDPCLSRGQHGFGRGVRRSDHR